MVGAFELTGPMFLKKAQPKPPMYSVPGEKDVDYPHNTHWMLIRATRKKLCMMVESTFLRRTIPP